ncbi:hypothetical protein FC093_01015 [Ilyomonas limi]|uniref:Uncharacterized protein n=1 Tax=Ilyomonas limi TaxID=2575867 RepID=A0A4U3L8H8_9BACT|nr:hypothetical protein [Ilyomonas limi]TKK71635.1 hypothetical protein FC093_01015 [Ilyomonas limi]
MRRVIAIFLLCLQLFTGTELCQLFKAPVLLEHYREHKGGDESLTFLSYLREHYFNSDERNPDYARDMQLPFKSCAGVLLASHSISIPIPGFTIVPPAPAFEIEKQYQSFKGDWQPSQIINTIFQPPRAAEA